MTPVSPVRGKILPDAEFQYLSDLALGSQRIGDTSKKALGWFLKFSQCDLSTLSSGDWTNLQYELTSFRMSGVYTTKKALALFKGEEMFFPGYDSRDRANPQEGLITQSEILEFQLLARETLEAIREKRAKDFKFPSLERRFYYDPSPSTVTCVFGKEIVAGPRWRFYTSAENPMEALTYAMLDLLKDHADCIRQCPEFAQAGCQRLFLAERKNQYYCSVDCQSRAATRRYRIEHGLSSGRPRGRPRKTNTIQAKPAHQKPEIAHNRRRPHGKTKR